MIRFCFQLTTGQSPGESTRQLAALDGVLADRLAGPDGPGLLLVLSGRRSADAVLAPDTPPHTAIGILEPPLDPALLDRVLDRLWSCRAAVTAVCVGACTGILAELAIHCGRRLAVDDAGTVIGFAHTAVGELPRPGTIARLIARCGCDAAALLIVAAPLLPPGPAVAWQLIDRLVADTASCDVEMTFPIGEDRADTSLARGALAAAGPLLESVLASIAHPSPATARAAWTQVVDPTVRNPAPTSARQRAALRHVAVLTERLAGRAHNWPGPVRQIRTVGICGAGIMGQSIAAAHVRGGLHVRLYDAHQATTDRAVDQVRQRAAGEARHPWYQPLFPANSPELIAGCTEEAELAACDLILESVVENRELKQQILRRLEDQAEPHVVLASNTSTVSISELARDLRRPDQLCGLHFCNPVLERRLVEIVRGSDTSASTVAVAVHHVLRIGKLPLVVADRPGFLINRLLVMYLNEALQMLCEGVDPCQIDDCARQFGMALGPFELLDTIGTDTAMLAGRTVWEAYPDRVVLNPVLPALVKRERLGRKTGRGFYCYASSSDGPRPDAELGRILAPYVRPDTALSTVAVMDRLLLPMVLEATRILDEEVVEAVQDIDTGVVFGLAFPAEQGGLLYWADQCGVRQLLNWQQRLESLGPRMAVTPRLRQMALRGHTFYGSA